MANLKDIGYGVGKYLEASDASGISDIGTNRTNIDLLNFKLAVNNAYALYNFKDGIIDAYQDASGVDASASTNESRDSSGKYYTGLESGSTTTTSFTTTGSTTWTVPSGVTTAEYLVLGGGGGASGGVANVNVGAGGAGGVVRTASNYSVTPGASLTVTVGAGGASALGQASSGGSSVFDTITATGGGGAGTGRTGGSNADYSGGTNSSSTYAGGGAGAGGNGSGSSGGVGVSSSITGSSITRGGGGASASGSASGGGATAYGSGTANFGGGGGGGDSNTSNGAGGSGIVILKYAPLVVRDLTLISNAQTAATQPSTARVTIFEHPSTGTTTVNTDIKAYASRDNGTTYTQITLADEVDYESGKKLLSGSVDISGQPAGTNMRYKIETLNQSSSKITRLHGVSLQWA